jgi:hypothetical protein
MADHVTIPHTTCAPNVSFNTISVTQSKMIFWKLLNGIKHY